jgi:hypothetical protein
MQRMQWYLGSLIMGAILLLPLGIRAATNLQQDQNQAHKLADDDKRDRNEKRYYDRDRKEYHSWDDREDSAYRKWMTKERHATYRPFAKLKANEQREYWKWRHEHPDNDRDRR